MGVPIGKMSHNKGPLKTQSANLLRDTAGNKKCTRCETWVPEGYFKKNSHMADGLISFCKRCYQDKDYNLDLPRRSRLLEQQNWTCAIEGCRNLITLYGPDTYHVDHNHSCCPGIESCGDCIRGLLCNRCNRMLGYVNDDAEILLGMARYLRPMRPHVIQDEGVLDVE